MLQPSFDAHFLYLVGSVKGTITGLQAINHMNHIKGYPLDQGSASTKCIEQP